MAISLAQARAAGYDSVDAYLAAQAAQPRQRRVVAPDPAIGRALAQADRALNGQANITGAPRPAPVGTVSNPYSGPYHVPPGQVAYRDANGKIYYDAPDPAAPIVRDAGARRGAAGVSGGAFRGGPGPSRGPTARGGTVSFGGGGDYEHPAFIGGRAQVSPNELRNANENAQYWAERRGQVTDRSKAFADQFPNSVTAQRMYAPITRQADDVGPDQIKPVTGGASGGRANLNPPGPEPEPLGGVGVQPRNFRTGYEKVFFDQQSNRAVGKLRAQGFSDAEISDAINNVDQPTGYFNPKKYADSGDPAINIVARANQRRNWLEDRAFNERFNPGVVNTGSNETRDALTAANRAAVASTQRYAAQNVIAENDDGTKTVRLPSGGTVTAFFKNLPTTTATQPPPTAPAAASVAAQRIIPAQPLDLEFNQRPLAENFGSKLATTSIPNITSANPTPAFLPAAGKIVVGQPDQPAAPASAIPAPSNLPSPPAPVDKGVAGIYNAITGPQATPAPTPGPAAPPVPPVTQARAQGIIGYDANGNPIYG